MSELARWIFEYHYSLVSMLTVAIGAGSVGFFVGRLRESRRRQR